MRVIDARFVHDAFEPKLAAIQRTYLYRFTVSYTKIYYFSTMIVSYYRPIHQ
jgi:tRNA U38,U39,U40 pseudouridine synthase TruA